MAKMTPEDEAAYALSYGLPKSDLPADVQEAYDRLVEQRAAAAAAPATAAAARETGAGYPPPPWQYPQAPLPPGARPGAVPERPDSMKWAIGLMWAGAAMSVVYSVVNGVATHDLFTVRTTNTPTSHSTYYGGSGSFIPIAVVLWLWMIWKVWTGRFWARVLSSIFCCVTCLQFVIGLATGPGVSKALVTVYFAIALAALIMLFRPESSAFFDAAKRARAFAYSYGPPGYAPPAYGPPAYGPPAYGPPGYGPPGYGPPGHGPPGYGPPGYGPPPQQNAEPPQQGGQQSPSGDWPPPL